MAPTIGFFTRLLDDASAPERYATALDHIALAEQLGFRSTWVAQHHLDGREGGLPSPFVLLAAAAARTSSIRLGTAILTLAHEQAARAAEDAAVLDAIAGGRVELGLGTGGSPRTLSAFGEDPAQRRAIYDAKLHRLRTLLDGSADEVLYPPATGLADRLWQATFSPEGAGLIGAAGDGLMLSRIQPPFPALAEGERPRRVWEVQRALVDEYRAALPEGVAPRILASRTVVVVDDEATGRRIAEAAARAIDAQLTALHGAVPEGLPLEGLLERAETVVGTPRQVIAALERDAIAHQASEVSIQVHSVDPPAQLVARSLELFATEVAPALGWRVGQTHEEERHAA